MIAGRSPFLLKLDEPGRRNGSGVRIAPFKPNGLVSGKVTNNSYPDAFSLPSLPLPLLMRLSRFKWRKGGMAISRILGTTSTAWTVFPADVITLSDALSKVAGKPLADTITLSDAPAKSVSKSGSDTITLSDGTTKALVKSASDTITLSDATSKVAGKSVSDTITLSDQIARAYGLSRTDTITLTEAPGKTTGKALADSISLSDQIAKLFGLNEADTIALSDFISLPGAPVAYAFILSDVISLSDTSVQVLVSGVPVVPVPSFPAQFSGLKIFYGDSARELSMVAEKDAPGSGDILKIHKNGVNYVVSMVEVNDANASRLRIRTTTGTKAIRLKT